MLLARGADGGFLTLAGGEARERFHGTASIWKRPTIVHASSRPSIAAGTDRLTYFGHWITPEGAVRRYDTRFFIAAAPERQVAAHDNREVIAHEWVRPATCSTGIVAANASCARRPAHLAGLC